MTCSTNQIQALNKSKNAREEDDTEDEKTTKKRAVEDDETRPTPAPVDNANETDKSEGGDNALAETSLDDPSLRTYLHHHSRLLVKNYEAQVKIQNSLVNLQEVLSHQSVMMQEAACVYVSSQYLTNKIEVLGPKFPAITGWRKPDFRSEGLSRLDTAEVPDLYEEIKELASKVAWRCPNDGCGESIGSRKGLRKHLK